MNNCLSPTSAEIDFTINSISNLDATQWNSIGSSHPGGATFGRADGTVEFVSETVDGVVYEAMGTKANGEVESLN